MWEWTLSVSASMKVWLEANTSMKIMGRNKRDNIVLMRFWNGHQRRYGFISLQRASMLMKLIKRETPEPDAFFVQWVAIKVIISNIVHIQRKCQSM